MRYDTSNIIKNIGTDFVPIGLACDKILFDIQDRVGHALFTHADDKLFIINELQRSITFQNRWRGG